MESTSTLAFSCPSYFSVSLLCCVPCSLFLCLSFETLYKKKQKKQTLFSLAHLQEFVVQHSENANPPTFFLTVETLLQRMQKEDEMVC